MIFNERKEQTLRFFSRREWVRPTVYAVNVGFYPTRASYAYLKRLHRWSYLKRGHDFQGQLVYRLSSRGANWLLRRDRLQVQSRT